MRNSKRPRESLSNMKVIFIKLIGGPKVTIGFFLGCGVLLLLSLIDKPREVMIPSSPRQGPAKSRKNRKQPDEDETLNAPHLPLFEMYPMTDIIWEPSTLASGLQEPLCMPDKILMILVSSLPEQEENRRAVRNTWGTLKKLEGPHHHQTVFVVGLPTDDRQRLKLLQENDKYGDILFVNIKENSKNFSAKVQTFGLHWAWTHCRPSYLLKSDDDCFVNVKLLTKKLVDGDRVTPGLYVGQMSNAPELTGKLVDKLQGSSKHRAYKGEYPFKLTSGRGYLLSGDVLESVVSLAPFVSLLPTADAHVGLLAHLSGVRLKDSGRFTFYSNKWQVCNFLYLLVLHGVSPEEQYLCLRYSDECEVTCAGQLPGPTGWS